MKIALIGYGKMGHAIERIAVARGHEIVCKIDADNTGNFDTEAFKSADVAIEFTTPSTAVDNYLKAFDRGVKVVSGTTGWLEREAEIKALCDEGKATLFWTSNFSLGVNIFFAVNRYLAAVMSGFPQYTPSLEEIHHIHKLDHPSGTAITLAQGIIDEDLSITAWEESDDVAKDTLKVTAVREGEVPGTHIVRWDSEVDTLTIEHRAKSREGFALGAVVAAEWTASRKGWLTMDEMMHSLVSRPELLDTL
ncbi:MAG: 4-hydroxy-tetrahydrodipicolinate reductase [Muribaculum sp.]|nr:4-hydroxy-tetrahydrodipicolinate reductase [Muribaculum sp.]